MGREVTPSDLTITPRDRRVGRGDRTERWWLVLAALGDSLMGGPMASALGLPREQAREIATRHLIHLAAERSTT